MKGPSKVNTISCIGCEFLNQSMVHSGRNPLYDYQCCNPAVNDGESYICNSHEDSIISTPEWCPLRGK